MIHTEDNWTPPSQWCPKPHRWHAPDCNGTEAEVSELVAAFVRATQPDLVVETGSHLGATAELIGEALRLNGHGVLHTLEPDETFAAATRERCRGLPVEVHQVESLQWEPPGPVDFAWLDSLFDLRVPELAHLRPWLTPAAVVGIHDTGPQHPLRGMLEDLPDGFDWLDLRTPRGVIFGQFT